MIISWRTFLWFAFPTNRFVEAIIRVLEKSGFCGCMRRSRLIAKAKRIKMIVSIACKTPIEPGGPPGIRVSRIVTKRVAMEMQMQDAVRSICMAMFFMVSL